MTVYVHERVDQVKCVISGSCTSMGQPVSLYGKAYSTSAPGCSPASPCDVPLPVKPRSVQGIRPLDDYQRMALDVLSDDDVRCVALMEVAGGGETLLALATGLDPKEHQEYESIIAIKPVVPVGNRDIGYLKGDKDEKTLQSWLTPVFDNLRILQMHRRGSFDVEMMRETGQLQIEALTYLRGRTLHGYWVILDEMQDTTHIEATTALSRMGEKTKCVMLADLSRLTTLTLTPSHAAQRWPSSD